MTLSVCVVTLGISPEEEDPSESEEELDSPIMSKVSSYTVFYAIYLLTVIVVFVFFIC